MPLREMLAPLAEQQFRRLFVGRSISVLGSAFAPVALAFAVLDDLDGSPSQLGIVLAAMWVPQVVFILIGGIWADRLPRNVVMVATDLVMAAVQGMVALLLLTDAAEIWHLVALQLVRGVANSFFFPAASGIVPSVVSPSRLQQANALLRMTHSGGQIFGAASAGVVVAVVGSGSALAVDAASFLVSAVFLAGIRLPRREAEAAPSFARELREGWGEFVSRTWLWLIVVQFLFVNGFSHSALLVLGPVVAKDELGGAAVWGLILGSEGVGMVLGGVLALRFRPRRILLVATLSMFLFAPVPILLAEAVAVPLIIAAAVGLGIGFELFGVMWDTALQQQIPRDRLSRVYSWDMLGSFVAIPLGLSIVGPLADAVGVEATLVASSVVTVVASALVLLSRDVRTLRRLDDAEPDEVAPTPPGGGFALPTTEPAP
jgi:predicted MFS family arabinose efflux permease